MDLSEEFWIFVSKHINEHPCVYYKYSTESEDSVAARGKTWFGDWERFKIDYVGSHSIMRVLSTLRTIKDDVAENYALNIEKAINELAVNIENVKVNRGDRENT